MFEITIVRLSGRFSMVSVLFTRVLLLFFGALCVPAALADPLEVSATDPSCNSVGAGLTGVQEGSVAWGDYDDDGDLDILLTGSDGSTYVSQVYRNDGGTFTDIEPGLTGVYWGSVAWGDYDNDGDLDILLTGENSSYDRVSEVYRNDGGTFTKIEPGLTGVVDSSVAWGDYDNDGDLDILLTGESSSWDRVSEVYRNDEGIFTDIGAGLTGVFFGSVAWGDYDNDGDLDILLTGAVGQWDIGSQMYRNEDCPPEHLPPAIMPDYERAEADSDVGYIEVLLKEIDRLLDNRKDTYGVQATIAPDPMLSIFMDDCIEKGRDIANGGARYLIYPPVINGIANTTDSLVAIKKLVFEDKLFTMQELVEAMKNNFEGKEPMRQQLIAWAPKFGNDDDYADEVAIRMLKDVAAHIKARQAKYPWIMTPPALGTFEHYMRFGLRCGASADGRLARETLSTNYSPSVGRDTSGPTAAVLSHVKADLLPFVSGCPLDIQINSNEVSGEAGIERLTGLIRSFMDLGGLIFTITGVSEDILRDAQAHPKDHKGLRVRLGGFSGYFVALPPKHQEIMINRIKHGV